MRCNLEEMNQTDRHYDVIILGGGAAGLFCAAECAKSLQKVLLIEGNKKVALKVQISGGGRCNFTNLNVTSQDFVSENSHFMKSALAQFSSEDFISLVEKYEIDYYEKKMGQLFCKKNSLEIINMLLNECKKNKVEIHKDEMILDCNKEEFYKIKTSKSTYLASNVVVATGGLSFEKLGASDIGYKIARKFCLKLTQVYPSLVPLTFPSVTPLSGISLKVSVECNKSIIKDDLLFTHKGFSGPAVLKISLYWNQGDLIKIDFMPEIDLYEELIKLKRKHPQKKVEKILYDYLPQAMVLFWINHIVKIKNQDLQSLSLKDLKKISDCFKNYEFSPTGTEGYKKAEVTKGGVHTNELSSKTLMSKKHAGLYFIGEVVDVTGLLGGYNFQWAWSSAFVAARSIRESMIGEKIDE